MSVNILIIDDDENIINSLKRLFRNLPYAFDYCIDSQQALSFIKNKAYAVIVTDQEMAKVKGIDILKSARRESKNVSLILMTGYSNIDVIITAVNQAGIFKYISKPWDNHVFIETIHKAVEAKEKQDMNDFIYRFLSKNKILESSIKISEKTLKESFMNQNLNLLTKVLESKDIQLYNHSKSVAEFAVEFSRYYGLTKEQQDKIYYSGLLHDIGKIAIRDQILYKSDRLTSLEHNTMKDHALIGAEIIKQGFELNDIAEIVKQHHESYNGAGYPMGLVGDEILIEAQILCIADVYIALTEKRTYKAAYKMEKIIQILYSESGKKFSQELTEKFLAFLKQKESYE